MVASEHLDVDMKQLIISLAIAISTVVPGCSIPGKPVLRIAIMRSAGSSVLYVAQEAKLFEKYEVNVQLVEVSSGCESGLALMDGHVDAAVMPGSDLAVIEHSGAEPGIILLVSASFDSLSCIRHKGIDSHWSVGPSEVLAGDRTALMQRREDWERVLLAYEHARLLLAGEPNIEAARIAAREKRLPETVIADLERWEIFSVTNQDSLLSSDGPYAYLNAHWQGRSFLTLSVAKSSNPVSDQNGKWNGVTSK